MGRRLEVEIYESQEELEKTLKNTRTASSKERLQMLYLLKSKQVWSRQELAQVIGRDNATITRWMRKYKDEGLRGLLKVKQAPGKTPLVRGKNLERLKQRLQEPRGFNSYGEIQEWIARELGVKLAYKSVYQLVRYQLKAKLKVPRPQSIKQNRESQTQFKKNCQSL